MVMCQLIFKCPGFIWMLFQAEKTLSCLDAALPKALAQGLNMAYNSVTGKNLMSLKLDWN